MPSDPLLLAFALTLVLNAVIVIIAIRALRSGATDGADGTGSATAGPARRAMPNAERPAGPAAPAEPRSAPAAPPPVAQAVPAAVHDAPRPGPTAPTPAPKAPPEPAPESRPRTTTKTSRATGSGGSGRRRKFSLPPLDEDHEKVSRSIETFLGVADDAASAPSTAPSPAPATATDASAPVAVVTVAVIQLDGPGPHDLLERTVRATARAADQVSVDRRGRVRVVLPGTGEVAAKAYLRRIRAIVEPIAETTDPPSRIVIATATEIDGSIVTARRRADRRLASALRGPSAPVAVELADDDDVREPRAAGD